MQHEESVASGKPTPREEGGTICLYPSKRCDSLRIVKTNGQLHKFCQFHRDKANYNQRQLEFKRRLRQEQEWSGAERKTPNNTGGLQPGLATLGVTDEDFELDEEDIRLIEEVAAANIAARAPLNK